jgi:predicted nucleic acid-binding protein
MGILIDSSVLIAWERDRLDLESQLADCADEDFAISAITASELLQGFIAPPIRRSAAGEKPLSKACWRGSRSFLLMALPLVSTFGSLRS